MPSPDQSSDISLHDWYIQCSLFSVEVELRGVERLKVGLLGDEAHPDIIEPNQYEISLPIQSLR